MKTIILAIAVLFAANTATFAQGKKSKTTKTTTAKQYTCSMHPEVVTSKPGKCPKCNMALVAKANAAVTYTCSMDPEVVKSKPGTCPKCGMKLTKTTGEKSMQDSTDMKM